MAEIRRTDMCVVVNAPEWFKDPGFVRMLNYQGDEPEKYGGCRTATWHVPGDKPNEYSDVFMIYDGEQSDSDFLSDEIWAEIEAVAEEALAGSGRTFCILWIQNLGV